jgi:gluconolactonase
VELEGGHLSRLTPDGMERYEAGGAPNGLAFDGSGRAWIVNAELNCIQRFDPDTQLFEVMADTVDGEPLRGPNDLLFDAAGNLLFTCPVGSGEQSIGYVCCLSPDGAVRKIGEGLRFPNGLALTDGGAMLVVAETSRQRLWRGAWDASARIWRDPEPWAETGDGGGPDGMALGADGLLYVAIFGGGQVRAIGPDGRIAATHDIPGANVTNAAFDPSGRLGLVVTETERGVLVGLPDLGPGAPLYGGEAWG